jgi:hypothetical protein
MNRRSLGALAIVIIILMIFVALAGLDNLPRNLRSSIAAASTELASDRSLFTGNRDYVTRALSSEPELFRTKAALYRNRLDQGNACLATADSQLAGLQQLAKQNRRQDTSKAEAELAKFEALRKGCGQDATGLRAEAERWVNYKRELPKRLAAMKASYESVHAFDIDAAVAPARKAQLDWPAKRDDVESRVTQLKGIKTQAEGAWDSSAKLRAEAEANDRTGFDYAAFFQSADRIDEAARQLKTGGDSINQLAAQLYTSWDKLLLDVDDNHGVREKVRLVKTKYKDATLASGEASSEERWEDADSTRKHDAEKTVGMVIARKPAGKYDSEVERTVQPPAIAYVAPPGQSNSYGSWQNGVWSWLPQYLILSHMLNASRGPIGYPDYEGYYQARRRGETYYGREGSRWWNSDRSVPSRGSGGGILGRARDWANSRSGNSGTSTGGDFYKERPKTYNNGGGYSGSQYQNRGSYSGSRYQNRGGGYGSFGSRAAPRSGGFGGGRSFGRGRR